MTCIARGDDAEPSRDLLRYLIALHGRTRDGLIEVRYRDPTRPGRWRQAFLPASRPASAASVIRRMGEVTDAYVGVATRHRPSGRRDALGTVNVVWVDLDGPEQVPLTSVAVPPGIEIRSGTAGHRHLYWLLYDSVSLKDAKLANRRLAALLAGDGGAVCNAAAILRPPATLSFKHSPATPVLLEYLRPGASARRSPTPPLSSSRPFSRRDAQGGSVGRPTPGHRPGNVR